MTAEGHQNTSPPEVTPSADPPRLVRPRLLDTIQYHSTVLGETARKHIARQWFIYIIISVVGTAIALAISFGVAYSLVVSDIDLVVPVQTGGPAVIQLDFNLLSIDPKAGTVNADWYPRPVAPCVNAKGVTGATYDIFFDPNLSNESGGTGSQTPSDAPPSDPTFRFNTSIYCNTTLSDSAPTFRTTSKLITDDNAKGSLQAYPFDLYKSQISLFVVDTETNRSVPAEIVNTWGVAVNFEVALGDPVYNTDEGMYFPLSVSRSRAVKYFVIIIVIANWIVTIVFLWITVACIFWKEEVVKELFIVPVSTLFAFTAVRASMPGAPDGFGAVVDVAGVLPNLALMTFCSFILLILVLYERIVDTHQEMKKAARAVQTKKLNKPDADSAGDPIRPEIVCRIEPVEDTDKMRPSSLRSEGASQASLRRGHIE